MGKKAGKYKRKEDNNSQKKKSVRPDSANEDMMDDEIDACMCILLFKHMMLHKFHCLKIVVLRIPNLLFFFSLGVGDWDFCSSQE